MADRRTQNATVMSLIVIGEAAAKVMESYPEFVLRHPEMSWHSMRGMRNRIAHGYYEINFDVIWETTQTALPDMLAHMANIRFDIGDDRENDTCTLGKEWAMTRFTHLQCR